MTHKGTESEVEKLIGTWLYGAKDRCGGRKLRRKRMVSACQVYLHVHTYMQHKDLLRNIGASD